MLKSPEPPKNPEILPTETPQTVAKPVKEKKPRTEAQQAATVKALAAMTAKRKELNEKAKEKKEEIKKAKKVIEEKMIKEDIGFVMKNDFDTKISSLMKEVGELRGLLSAAQQQKTEKPIPAPKPERIVERVIERVPERSTTPTRLTGTALLDRLFFDK